ncbi:MAG: SH3 domain-containing protein, partial [Burkholderiales bacterium]
ASTSGSMSGRISLAILAVICLGLGIYFVGGRQTANSSSRSENIGRVSTENLNLRSNPGTNQPVIMQLPQGTKVIILNESQNIGGTSWVKVRVGQQEGWVNQKHIQ